MKGPFERLKYDLRRVWECPECHHRERSDGTVTSVVCRCQAQKELLDRVVMKLLEDRIQRRLPRFVPPGSAEEPGTPPFSSTIQGPASPENAAAEDSPSEL